MVKKFCIEKAGNTPGRAPIEDVFISIHNMGTFDDPVDFSSAVMKSDAEDLHEALRASLPQGTFDRLLALMLQSRAATAIRAYAEPETKENQAR